MQLGVIYDLQEWQTSESGDIWREMAPVGPILAPFLPPLPLTGASFATNFAAIPATFIGIPATSTAGWWHQFWQEFHQTNDSEAGGINHKLLAMLVEHGGGAVIFTHKS